MPGNEANTYLLECPPPCDSHLRIAIHVYVGWCIYDTQTKFYKAGMFLSQDILRSSTELYLPAFSNTRTGHSTRGIVEGLLNVSHADILQLLSHAVFGWMRL